MPGMNARPLLRASRRPALCSASRILGLALACPALVSCAITGISGRSGDDLELARNRQRWASAAIRDYEFEFHRSCFCVPETTEPVRITVRNHLVSTVVRTRDGQLATTSGVRWPTVDSLFADVDALSASEPERLVVDYDPTYGYPRSIAVDVSLTVADDEYTLSAANLRRLP